MKRGKCPQKLIMKTPYTLYGSPVNCLSSWRSQYNTLEHKQDLYLMELTTIDYLSANLSETSQKCVEQHKRTD